MLDKLRTQYKPIVLTFLSTVFWFPELRLLNILISTLPVCSNWMCFTIILHFSPVFDTHYLYSCPVQVTAFNSHVTHCVTISMFICEMMFSSVHCCRCVDVQMGLLNKWYTSLHLPSRYLIRCLVYSSGYLNVSRPVRVDC